MNLEGANVLVTGANRGLGPEIIRSLLAAGTAKVYAAARDESKLGATIDLDPSRVLGVTLDITEEAQVDAAAREASDVTLLINNAGVLDFAGALDTTRAEIDRNMATNFHGTFSMTKAFAPVIEANGGGEIVNVLSVLSFVSAPIFSAYNASKAASWSMAMSLRPYLEPKGVKIVNVFPTTIDTEMVAGLDKIKAKPADVAHDIVASIEADMEDIYPVGAKKFYEDWREDQKGIERYYAGLA